MQHDFNDPAYCKALKNLFTPGSGGRPPVLAGREAEQALLGDYLDAATEDPGNRGRLKRPIPHDIILYGPRGNGKTVLLREFAATCRAQGAQVIELDSSEIDTIGALARELAPPPRLGVVTKAGRGLWRLLVGHDPSRAATGASVGVPGVASAGVSLSDREEKALANALRVLARERTQQGPLVVVLDEAHVLDVKVGRRLLNLSQNLRTADSAPFLLVLAGTPNLEAHLGKMDATFWDRSKVVPIGRLDAPDAQVALVAPLVDKSVRFDPGALARVVADSQAYPYFIQLWGKALCDVLIKSKQGKLITAQVVDEAFPAVALERRRYYSVRYNELNNQDLLPAGRTLAGAFAGQCLVHEEILLQALSRELSLNEKAGKDCLGRLAALGTIWRPDPDDNYEPGIPSLMTYVQERSATKASVRKRAQRPATDDDARPDSEDRADDDNDDGGNPGSP